MTKDKEICPSCGQAEGVPLIVGFPAKETFEAAARGEVILGGCIVWDGSNRQCRTCRHRWESTVKREPG